MCKNSLSYSVKFYLSIAITIIIAGSIVVGSIGAASYVSEKHDENVYKPTMCFVKNYAIVPDTCVWQHCQDVGSDEQCSTQYYTCDTALYTVVYNTLYERQTESSTKATGGPGADSVSALVEFEIMK
jgi:hypothetical protein